MNLPDHEVVAALCAIWRIPRPGPDNLFAEPRFLLLRDLCADRYGSKATIALGTALRAMGMPSHLCGGRARLALDIEAAAITLDLAFGRRRSSGGICVRSISPTRCCP